jgi:ubiquinone/menaquinone biosynthesis C-methylase UbiE
MDFYSEFSKNYDKIFPLNSKKIELIDNTFKDLKEKRKEIELLDVGCGTGSYAIALAEKDYQVKGIDLDAEMISIAESKMDEARVKVDFYRMGMLNLKKKFKAESFDGIYIIGNVLVHLKKDEIKNFLNLATELLKENGKIFIQIVNYNRILELNLDGLPTIYSKDDSVRFERNYKYNKKENIIYFKTKLIDHFDDQILSENKIELYPICRNELELVLKRTGFKIEKIYGSPAGDNYRELSSIPLIITAQKNK